jgi:hypothetical protein
MLWLASSPPDLASDDLARPDELIAIPAHDGIAMFDLPCRDDRQQFLIVVSSLATEGGPFAVNVSTERTDDPKPLVNERFKPDAVWTDRMQLRRKQLAAARRAIEPVEARAPAAAPAAERSFAIMVRGSDFALAKNYQTVRARLAKAGEYCAAYVDSDCELSEELQTLVQDAVRTFDREVYPVAVRTFGRHRDMDGDGRFAILFTPWLGKLSDGAVSLGGFVRGSDFYSDIEPPLGNRCDMMYLNSTLKPGPHLRTLIAHEYTHAITLCEHVFSRYLPDRLGAEEESWLDEAIAHIAENLHGYSWSNLDYRVSAFLNSPERYRLVVEDYYAADLWRSHGNRGSTYLFLRWCVDQYGEQILRDLVQTNLYGVESIEVATGRPFEELFRDWSAAMFLSHSGMAGRPEESLRHLNPRATLTGRLLAGPRYEFLSPSNVTRQFTLAGTSSKYFLAHSAGAAPTRVCVETDTDAKLQVSVRRLPAALARLELKVTPAARPDADGSIPAHIELIEHNGAPVQLEHLAWECSASGSNRDGARGFCSKILGAEELATHFGSTTLPASGSLTASNLRIHSHSSSEPLTLKVTGRDAAGHAVSAWCSIPRVPEILAGRNDDVNR